jgi:putative hydrolase of the HAD superfamily
LLDLDDTILDDTGNVEYCWHLACFTHCSDLPDVDPATILRAIENTRDWFWSDPERHRIGRLDLAAARLQIVKTSLVDLGIDNPALAMKISDTYHSQREAGVRVFPDALDTVRWLRQQGRRLALVTNGAADAQRSKVIRFGLQDLFDLVLIEGEVGFGKPDPRIYAQALDGLGVAPTEAWMAGDNLEWDVIQPQKLGIYGIWVDARRRGLPPNVEEFPKRIIQRLSELRGIV